MTFLQKTENIVDGLKPLNVSKYMLESPQRTDSLYSYSKNKTKRVQKVFSKNVNKFELFSKLARNIHLVFRRDLEVQLYSAPNCVDKKSVVERRKRWLPYPQPCKKKNT